MKGADPKGQLGRLKSRKRLQQLFSIKPLFTKNVRVHFSATPEEELQLAYSAPKRNFKRAVDRNRIKRLLREAVRLELPLCDVHPTGFGMFIYQGKAIPQLQEVRLSIAHLLRKMATVSCSPDQGPKQGEE